MAQLTSHTEALVHREWGEPSGRGGWPPLRICEQAYCTSCPVGGQHTVADTADRSSRDNIHVHGVPENAETSALTFLMNVFPRWFPNLGSVEIMRAHCIQ